MKGYIAFLQGVKISYALCVLFMTIDFGTKIECPSFCSNLEGVVYVNNTIIFFDNSTSLLEHLCQNASSTVILSNLHVNNYTTPNLPITNYALFVTLACLHSLLFIFFVAETCCFAMYGDSDYIEIYN
jgi:hypothetical protein